MRRPDGGSYIQCRCPGIKTRVYPGIIEPGMVDACVQSSGRLIGHDEMGVDAMQTTKHNHQMAFGRLVTGCARCTELKIGMPARKWAGVGLRQAAERQQIAEIRAHNCRTAGCGPVCTFGDW